MSKTSGTKRKASESAGSSDWKKKKTIDENEAITENVLNNDDCIRAILSYLPIEDLAKVSHASHVMKMNADFVFKKVHSAAINVAYDPENFSQQQMIFRQFGTLATKVEVTMPVNEGDDCFHDDGNKILRTIGHFCGSNLKDLTLRNMKIDLSSTDYTSTDRVDVQEMLAKLLKLTLMTVCIKIPFLQWTRSLQELMVHSSCHLETLPEITTLPQLKIFSIGACPMWPIIVGDSFNRFLGVNPSIEELDYHFIIIADGYLESICSLPNLTRLKLVLLECDDEDLSVIASARKLNKLTVYAMPRNHRKISQLRNMLPTGCEFSVENLG